MTQAGEPLKIFTFLSYFFFPGEYQKSYFVEGYTARNGISLRRYFH